MVKRILFVFTSAEKTVTGGEAGWYLPEAAHPYYSLASKYEIDFAAPAGPNPPVNSYSVKTFTDHESTRFLNDPVVKEKLANAKRLSEINTDDYDAVFYPGGHGPVMDLAKDPENIKIANEFYRAQKAVAAVCHGVGALVGVTDVTGQSIFAGKEVTAFSNAEEEWIDKVADVPFLVETEIVKLGGKYTKAEELAGVKVVSSGNLYTGQNPASAKPLGEELLKALSD